MRYSLPLLMTAAVLTVASTATAQRVQLPEFRFNTVGTTVSVPDRGGVSLGGVSRSSTGRAERGVPILGKLPGVGGLFDTRATGRSDSVGNFSVHATIIDLKELDEAVLAEAAARRRPIAAGPSPAELKAGYLSRHIGRRADAPLTLAPQQPVTSVAEIQRRNAVQAAERTDEAWKFFQKGQAAEAAGKANVARIYYNMAGRRADDQLKSQIEARLANIADQ